MVPDMQDECWRGCLEARMDRSYSGIDRLEYALSSALRNRTRRAAAQPEPVRRPGVALLGRLGVAVQRAVGL